MAVATNAFYLAGAPYGGVLGTLINAYGSEIVPEGSPAIIYGQGTPGAIPPFTLVNKGSLYMELNATDNNPSLLHHEARHESDAARDDERPAFHRYTCPRAGIAAHEDLAAAHGAPHRGAHAARRHDRPAHQIVAQRPARVSPDGDAGSIHQTGAEIADAAFEGDVAGGEYADGQVVSGLGIEHPDLLGAIGRQRLDLEIQFASGQSAGV